MSIVKVVGLTIYDNLVCHLRPHYVQRHPIAAAITFFRRQTDYNNELFGLDDGDKALADYATTDARCATCVT